VSDKKPSKSLIPALGNLSVLVLPVTLYFNTLSHHYVLDDQTLILNNPSIRSGIKSIPAIFTSEYWAGTGFNFGVYRPLTLLTFAFENALFGNNPLAGHLVNILLYSLVCILLFDLLRQVLPESKGRFLAWITTLIFISHPVHTEVVAYVKSRDELLCMLGYLGSLRFLVAFSSSQRTRHLLGAGIFCAISLFSKETGLLILALGPIVLYFQEPKIPMRRWAAILSSLLLPILVYLVIRISILNGMTTGERDSVTFPLLLISSPWDRLAMSLSIVGTYLKLAVWPYPLLFDYSFDQLPLHQWTYLQGGLACLVTALLLAWGLKQYLKKEAIGLSLLLALLPLSIAFYYSAVIGFSLAERFLFFPSIGIALTLAVLAGRLPRKLGNAFLLLVLLSYSSLTWIRNQDWRDNLTLFRADIRHSENNSKLHFLLGRELRRTSETAGDSNSQKQLLEEAMSHLQKSVELYSRHSGVHLELGAAFGMQKNYIEARKELETAISYDPKDSDNFYILAMVDLEEGKPMAAIANLNRATELKPSNKRAWGMLARIYEKTGDNSNATRCIRTLQTLPDEALH
jgi:tetratricopeptide (TPR) repeat protein